MKMTQIYALPFLTMMMSASLQAQTENNISWALNDSNLTQTLSLVPKASPPTEMTQLLRQTYFEVDNDKVTTHKKVVNFFPRFVDAENHGSHSIYYNPNYLRFRIIAAASVTPEGITKEVDPSTM